MCHYSARYLFVSKISMLVQYVVGLALAMGICVSRKDVLKSKQLDSVANSGTSNSLTETNDIEEEKLNAEPKLDLEDSVSREHSISEIEHDLARVRVLVEECADGDFEAKGNVELSTAEVHYAEYLRNFTCVIISLL